MGSATNNEIADSVRYVAIARVTDLVPVADYSSSSPKISSSLLQEKLEKVLRSTRISEHKRLTITDQEVGSIHYDVHPACLYFVVCAPDYPQRIAFTFLAEVRKVFEPQFLNDLPTARHMSLSRPAKNVLRDLCDRFNRPQNVDKVANVSMQVDQVRDTMQVNLESALRNQDNIETLLDQTDTMRNEATGFQQSAHRTRDHMWWKNAKMQLIIFGLICLIVCLIVFFVLK